MKPEIKYYQAYFGPIVGRSAIIRLAERHYSPTAYTTQITTSQVVSVEENGNFETLNTKYVKTE